jgi:exopolysaccharide biosynthesis polyprenyl glycosylphosphotransferase
VPPLRCARLLSFVDASAGVLTLLAVLIWGNLAQMPDGLDSFLSYRISLKNVLLLGLFALAWRIFFRAAGLYDLSKVRRLSAETARLIGACSLGTILAVPFPVTSASGAFQFRHLFYFWLTSIVSAFLVRLLHRALFRRRSGRTQRRVLIVGSGQRALNTFEALQAEQPATCEVVGFVDLPHGRAVHDEIGRRTLGSLEELESILMGQIIDEVFITLPVKSLYHEIHQTIQVCERAGVRAKYSADIFESDIAWPQYELGDGNAVVAMNVVPDDDRIMLKRALDIVGSAAGLILFSPILLAAAAATKLTSPGPAIYAQYRYGLNKRLFRIYKLRTMVDDAEALQAAVEHLNEVEGPVFKILDDPRVTALGRFLRKTSIDELPQLVNVLKGEMSLVGPRPLPLRDVRRFTRASDMRRFSVRPGITCLWQVNGRNSVHFSDWMRLDLEYIDSWSLFLDFRILLRTIPAVLRGTGAN